MTQIDFYNKINNDKTLSLKQKQQILRYFDYYYSK